MASQIRQRVEMLKIDQEAVTAHGNVYEYVSVKINCLSSYHTAHDFEKEVKECTDYLAEWPRTRLLEELQREGGDPDATLEAAHRYLGGCMVPQKCPEGALFALDGFFGADPSPLGKPRGRYVGDRASPALFAKAHSLAARAYLDKVIAYDESPISRVELASQEFKYGRVVPLPQFGATCLLPPFSYLAYAATHANEAAKLSFVSPAVIMVGVRLRALGEAAGVDVDAMGGAKHFRALWRVVKRREREIHDEERKRQEKVARAENEYVCAREECGIRAEQRRALFACSGRCPPDLKPRYCSKACQTQDWKKHKAICKPLAVRKPTISDDDNVHALFELGEAVDDATPDEIDDADTDGCSAQAEQESTMPFTYRDRTIDIAAPGFPGGSIQVTSQTMDPAFMREFRDEVAKRIRAGGRGILTPEK